MVTAQSKKERAAEFKRLGRQFARRKAIGPKLAIPTSKAEQRQIADRAAAADLRERIDALRRKLAALQEAHDDEPDRLVTSAIAEQMHQVGKRLSELRRMLGALAPAPHSP